ncbi:hypothetical protein QBC34DRAFT_385365 [Podospora aff. communis PSN243]|uniref:Invertebrate defensins family profile domain-containing protein n=1 Tax=Podospora aff. communis PSN243 TaxID=3040156 RepID=A0AAV9G8D7_9PEZI|nr:hypothetical protein QBC34DRAFT_385365 [Podospora aff. communis PSN243]
MRFFAVIALLASLASAMPEPVAEPAIAEAEPLDKRACAYQSCVADCCRKSGCNGYLHCGNSYCSGGTCVCECRYG